MSVTTVFGNGAKNQEGMKDEEDEELLLKYFRPQLLVRVTSVTRHVLGKRTKMLKHLPKY
jgi:hypothetical protein